MKKIYKYLLLTMVASGSLFYSCETTELELLENPNSLTPEQADADLLLNRVQMEYLTSVRQFNNLGADLGRIDYMFGRNYFSNYGSGTLTFAWNNLYADMIPDIAAMEANHSTENDLSYHLGVAKVLQAHLTMLLVDYLGDIVHSQANNPFEYPNPALDDDQDVYTAAIALVDEAIGYFSSFSGPSAVSGTITDLFYGGDPAKWITLANTIKMRANLTTGNYAAVLSATNVISSTDGDLEFKHGTDIVLPSNDNRHPDYINDYRSDGANIYTSNWLMDLMVAEFGDEATAIDGGGTTIIGEGVTDPRRRYYFYRQNWRTPGNYALIEDVNDIFGEGAGAVLIFTSSGDGQTLQCSLQDTPLHLQFTQDEDIWCSVKLGYWGRTHGNDEGTPPDNFTRTASGVYPAGGSFDGRADAFPYIGESIGASFGQQVGLGNGGGGAGIEPIILASYVEFWKAEANLMMGNAAAASTNIENALTLSIAKVQPFAALDIAADLDEVPDAATVTAFIAAIKAEFDAAALTTPLDGNGYPTAKAKMDILGEQFFVTMFGGGADASNFIRRTGYPRTLARNTEGNPGSYPRTVLYPGSEVAANPNIQQRTDLSTLVFWDSGTINPSN